MTLYNPNLDLINVNVYTKFGLILSIPCQDIEQNEILTSIKGCNSVADLRKMKLYNLNIDFIKFCPLVLKILSGDKILTSIKGHNSVANFLKMTLYNPNLDLINFNMYTNFG